MEFKDGVISITDPIAVIILVSVIGIALIILIILAASKLKQLQQIKIGKLAFEFKKSTNSSSKIKELCKNCSSYLVIKNEKRDIAKAVFKIAKLKFIEHQNSGIVKIEAFINSMNNKLYNEYVISVCKNADSINDILKITEYFRISESLSKDLSDYLKDRLESNGFDNKSLGYYENANYVMGEWDRYKLSVSDNVKFKFLEFMSGELGEKISSNIYKTYEFSNKIWDSEISPLLNNLLDNLRILSVSNNEAIKKIIIENDMNELDFLD